MTPKLRIVTTALWGLAILSMCALLASWTTSKLVGSRPGNQPVTILKVEDAGPLPDIQAPAFSLTDQNNQPFSSDELKGNVWIADFFFTTCTGPCPLLTQKMSQLEKKLTDPRIRFVSFSIDPESDTPAAMKEYAAKFSPTPRWHFVTGGDNATYSIARALKLPAVPAQGNNPIFHTTKFALIAPTGRVAGYYDYDNPASLEKLTTDAQSLANSLPK